MKKQYLLAVLVAAVVASTGCDHLKSHLHKHEGSGGLPQLDNGKRWKADAPTKDGFVQLSADLKTFARQNPSPGAADYQALADRINASIQAVFAACTMTGPGHEQLHRYIQLILNDVAVLKEKDVDASGKAFKRIVLHTAAFGEYFE